MIREVDVLKNFETVSHKKGVYLEHRRTMLNADPLSYKNAIILLNAI